MDENEKEFSYRKAEKARISFSTQLAAASGMTLIFFAGVADEEEIISRIIMVCFFTVVFFSIIALIIMSANVGFHRNSIIRYRKMEKPILIFCFFASLVFFLGGCLLMLVKLIFL